MQAPFIALPTGAYQPLPGQTTAAYAIRVTDPETGAQSLMSTEGRVVRFPNEYRAGDVLGWVAQPERIYLEVVPYTPQPTDIPCQEWEKLNTGAYVKYSERRRLARLGLAGV